MVALFWLKSITVQMHTTDLKVGLLQVVSDAILFWLRNIYL